MQERPFVLSGGGIRGAAHLGALRAFHEAGVVPSAISGTSAGALAGALVADGRTPREAMALVEEEFKRPFLRRRPALASKRIAAFLERSLRHRRIEDLPIPLYISATNLERGGQCIFSSGELIPALMASCAIPLIFPPVQVGGTYCVDGGLSNNLPVEPFADCKAEVVAVHVNPLPVFIPGRRNWLRTMDRIWHLNFREMVMRSAQGCGMFVEPPELSRFNMFELGKGAAIERIGYDWTRALLAGPA
ncbi:MAG: patatin-like phospholipase family protein [Flavobacteriales bacterium]|nr:patatin-like phospholipase family protein [Flavobacteriales bacterium]HRO40340.1 patatin-like phospholipase family protein [Flavobacteriales bacterium]HRP81105.1 patatin-like phospholipase family protein [Flavobacteriales bacterium]